MRRTKAAHVGTLHLLHGNSGHSKGLSLKDWHHHSGLNAGHSEVWSGVCSVDNIDDAGIDKGLDRVQDSSWFSFLHSLIFLELAAVIKYLITAAYGGKGLFWLMVSGSSLLSSEGVIAQEQEATGYTVSTVKPDECRYIVSIVRQE